MVFLSQDLRKCIIRTEVFDNGRQRYKIMVETRDKITIFWHFGTIKDKKVMFIYNHCPFVKHLKKDIVKLSNFYMKKGLAVVAICSNFVATHPQTQDVARDFGAICTLEFFLFKKDGRRPFELVYHGQFDDSQPSNSVPVTGRDLSLAIDSVISGQPVPSTQKPSVGCSIKWHPQKIS